MNAFRREYSKCKILMSVYPMPRGNAFHYLQILYPQTMKMVAACISETCALNVCVCVCVRVYIYVYICVCVCVYIYIYIYILFFRLAAACSCHNRHSRARPWVSNAYISFFCMNGLWCWTDMQFT